MKNIFPKSIYIGTFYGTFHSFYIFDISTKPASSKKWDWRMWNYNMKFFSYCPPVKGKRKSIF